MTTEFLKATMNKYKPFLPIYDLILDALKSSHDNKIIDLCSGSSGPWENLKIELEKKYNGKIDITLTDKYPNEKLAELYSKTDGISFFLDSVDAKNVPKELKGMRTIVNGLHHFKLNDAQDIISNSVKSGQPIVILELLRKNWKDIFIVFTLTPIFVFLHAPFFLPLNFKNILFTYIIPILPFTLTWDTVISHLRCYTTKELENMSKIADPKENFIWHIERYRENQFPVLVMIGQAK